MIRAPRIGLLPFYLALYDECLPDARTQFQPFLDEVIHGLAARGIEVIPSDICRVADEFAFAVSLFEAQQVDLIISLHLAYSPSLESLQALLETNIPLLILDTTMDAAFDQRVDPDRIMYNHGVHGVMDLASVLRRTGRAFEIVAGHVGESAVLDRAAEIARGAFAASRFINTRALRIGDSFAGMGDFAVEEEVLEAVLGITVEQIELDELSPYVKAVTEAEITAEMDADRAQFLCELPAEVHRYSTRVGLGLRRLLEAEEFGAFSMNFLAFDRTDHPVCTVPFLEASKAMARGIGYGGEGDVLTAALVGALAQGFGAVTFTEIFCPDWRGGSLFLSHMGEINPTLAAAQPRVEEYPFPFAPTRNPAKLACGLRPGSAVFVNLAPGPNNTFTLIVAPVEMLPDTDNPAMTSTVRGWMRPHMPVADFLEAYSRHGGTHHSALVYGERTEALLAFARFAGMKSVLIS
jgi:L-arabinose isomerase